MPDERKEPQSYGSQQDWVTGKTGERVSRRDESTAPPESSDFYDSRHSSEVNQPPDGGLTSTVGNDESVAHFATTASDDELPVQRVTGAETGARRDSFFRKRDYS